MTHPSTPADASGPSIFDQILEIQREQDAFGHTKALLQWDMECMMGKDVEPSGRVAACSLLAGLQAEAVKKLPPLVSKCVEEDLSEFDETNLALIKTQIAYKDLPIELVKRSAECQTKCQQAWPEQRTKQDWSGYSSNLKDVVNCVRETAAILNERLHTASPYEAVLQQFEPGMTVEKVDVIFDHLKSWLPKIIDERRSEFVAPLSCNCDTEASLAADREIAKALGFTGRVDHVMHPFMTTIGDNSGDVRICTSRNARHQQTMYGVIHECGHARYEMALADLVKNGDHHKKYRGSPILSARSVGVHEGQSIFFERQLGTEIDFIEWMSEVVTQHPVDVASIDKYNRLVRPGHIRVEADAATYPMHIVLRYEIERDLINGVIEVDDIPNLWVLKMKQYLGITLEEGEYKDGCMQDVHWSLGAFGYFPTYTIGALIAAQMMEAMRKTVDVTAALKLRDITPITEWLNASIWKHASTKSTEALIKDATGAALSDEAFRTFITKLA